MVEDQKTWINVIEQLLSRHSIDISRTYEDAIDKINKKKPYDIIIVNINLLGVDIRDHKGTDVLDHLRAIKYQTEIVIFTGDPDPKLIEWADNYKPGKIFIKFSTRFYGGIRLREHVDQIAANLKNLSTNSLFDDNYASAIVAIMDSNNIIGSGFLVEHNNEIFIVTCAHVIHKIKEEGEEQLSVHSYIEDVGEINSEICWCSPPKSDPNLWSANEDIAILRPKKLDRDKINPLQIEEFIYEQYDECNFFGFSDKRYLKGQWIGKLRCSNPVGDGFIELRVDKSNPIDDGHSGSPLRNREGKILGMIQSNIKKEKIAYLIPSTEILKSIIKLGEKENE